MLELGTRLHPYKNINLPILELFNVLANLNKEVLIKLETGADHYLKHGAVAINNITSVTFQPYNSNLKQGAFPEYSKFAQLICRRNSESAHYRQRWR